MIRVEIEISASGEDLKIGKRSFFVTPPTTEAFGARRERTCCGEWKIVLISSPCRVAASRFKKSFKRKRFQSR